MEIIGRCGIISKKALTLLPYGTHAKGEQIRKMLALGWIKEKECQISFYGRKRKEYRTERGYVLWNPRRHVEEYRKEVTWELEDAMRVHISGLKKETVFRSLRQSEIMAMLYGQGLEYITAGMVKTMMDENLETTFDRDRIVSGRAYGIVIADQKLTTVYDLWNRDYQSLSRASETSFLDAAEEYTGKMRSGVRLVFGKNYGVLEGIIYKRAEYRQFRNGVTFLSDTTYTKTLLVPKSKDGRKILYLSMIPGAVEVLGKAVGGAGGKEEGERLNFLYPDVNAMSTFLARAQRGSRIIAYDVMKDGLEKVRGDVEVVYVSLDEVYDAVMRLLM